MNQPKTKKNEPREAVKLIQEIIPGNFLKLLENCIQHVINTEFSMKLKADPYQQTENRQNYRNGYRERKRPLNTGIGPVKVSIPKMRSGNFYPSIIEKYQRIDRALISVISEAYYSGVSTRKMNQLFIDLGIENINRSLVSRCSAQIDAEIDVWRKRTLDQHYIYVWLDAIYTKVRSEKGVRSTAVLIAIGLKKDGYKDVLGFHLGNRESYYNWKEFLQSLKLRGLERSELWISDEHDGIIKSIEECFPGQQRQRCIIHWMRNAQSKVTKTDSYWLNPLLSNLVSSKTRESFDLAWNNLTKEVEMKGKMPLLNWLDDTYHEIRVYLDFPSCHWSKIKCTNILERLNEELRRRERSIRIFPNEQSSIRLFGSILQGYSDDWTTGRICLTDPWEKIKANRKELKKLTEVANDGLKPCSASSAGLQPVVN